MFLASFPSGAKQLFVAEDVVLRPRSTRQRTLPQRYADDLEPQPVLPGGEDFPEGEEV